MKFQSTFASLLCAFVLIQSTPSEADPKVIKVPAAAAAPAPIDVSGNYDVSLNGFSLGSLDFNASVRNGIYIVHSDLQLSALLGAFKWRGVTRTAGAISGNAHRPQSYSFEFDGTGMGGEIRMGFSGAEITSLTVQPQSATPADLVPLERKHLKGALDPLSAIMAMTRVVGDDPCSGTFQLFDGKQRFDLTLGARRQEPLALPGGARDTLTVCKVKYTPVAGYRANAETKALATSNGIEIAFRRLSAAGMMLPHRVVIPTMAGDAVIEAQRVSISRAGGEVANAE